MSDNTNKGELLMTIAALKEQNAALAAQVEALRSVIAPKVLDLIRCGIGGNYGGSLFDKAMSDYHDPIVAALETTPQQHLANLRSEAVELVKIQLKSAKPARGELVCVGWVVDCIQELADSIRAVEYAESIRQEQHSTWLRDSNVNGGIRKSAKRQGGEE